MKASEKGATPGTILVDHDDFDYNTVASEATYVLDCRNRLPKAANVEHL